MEPWLLLWLFWTPAWLFWEKKVGNTDPNAPTNLDEEDGETPYELAEENEHFEVMELLRPYLK